MSSSSPFSLTCPSCELNHGVAKSVGFTGDQRTIEYKCPSCNHVWTATDHVPRLIALEPAMRLLRSRSASE